jgi:protein tyrosine phosphatase (PTP) superfamily phosphohydrolase (DUF442 family)
MNLGLIPLRSFGVLDPTRQIYRSAQPEYPFEFAWLRKMLGIEHIISLRAESKHSDMGKEYGMRVHYIPVEDHKTPTAEQVKAFQRLIKKLKGPILIHCEHGRGRTSTFCVIARVTNGLSLDSALKEEEEKFHYTFNHPAQVDFLKQNFK